MTAAGRKPVMGGDSGHVAGTVVSGLWRGVGIAWCRDGCGGTSRKGKEKREGEEIGQERIYRGVHISPKAALRGTAGHSVWHPHYAGSEWVQWICCCSRLCEGVYIA